MKVKIRFQNLQLSAKNCIRLIISITDMLNMSVLNTNYARIKLTRQINKSPKLRHSIN